MRGCGEGGVGTKKARECCLNRRRFRANFQNGVANVVQKPKVYIFDFIIAICHLFVRFEYVKI